MHVSDALISPPVALFSGAAAVALIAVASKKVKDSGNTELVPLMGVTGAFMFAAQMINFSIPGTGSSGHLIGGILLAAILGPWAAFLTLCSILIVQCFLFADGGILALGCNILNMAASSCLLAFPLIYKPIAGTSLKPARIMAASVVASVVALEIGAFAVTVETEASGITALPFSTFLKFMLPIHLVIGVVEGIVTGLLLLFVARYRPSVLSRSITTGDSPALQKKKKGFIVGVAVVALLLGGAGTYLASTNPDGLEWSVEKTAGEEIGEEDSSVLSYDTSWGGVAGAAVVLVLLWGVSSFVVPRIRKAAIKK